MASSRIRPWLKWGLLLPAGLLLLLAIVPFSLNTEKGRELAVEIAGGAAGARMELEGLRFSYSDGLALRGFTADGPAPVRSLALDELSVRIDWMGLLSGRVSAGVRGRGVRLKAALPEGAESEEAAASAEAVPDVPAILKQIRVPAWLTLDARVEEAAVEFDAAGRRFELSEALLAVDVEGASERAGVELTAESPQGAVAVSASVLPERLSVEASLPGLVFSAGVRDASLLASLESDIGRLTDFASPFLPSGLPSLAGRLRLSVSGPIPERSVTVRVQAGLQGARASGPELPFPVELDQVELSCEASVDERGELAVQDGSLRLPGVETAFRAQYDPSGGWVANASGLRLDVTTLMTLAAPLVPEGVKLASGSVELRELIAEGDADGPKAASLEGLAFALAAVRFPGDLRAAAVDGRMDSAAVRLESAPAADVLGLRLRGSEVGLPAFARPLSGSVRIDARGLSAMPAVRNVSVQAALDDGAVRLDLSGAVARRFSFSGSGELDLDTLGEYLSLPADSGRITLVLDGKGEAPAPDVLRLPEGALTASGLLDASAFLRSLTLRMGLDKVRLPRAATLLSSTAPLEIRLRDGLKAVRFSLPVNVSGAALPFSARVRASGVVTELDQAEWNVRTELPEHSLQVDSGGTASGMTRMLRRGGDPLSALLSTVTARTRHRVALDGSSAFNGSELSGKAELVAEADLLAADRLEGGLTVSMHELGGRFGGIGIEGLRGETRLRRSFRLVTDGLPPQAADKGLSRRVLERGEKPEAFDAASARGSGEMYFDVLEMSELPVPLSLSHGELVPEFGATPGLRRFGFDLLGGSVRGSALLHSGPEPDTRLEAVFTSLDFSRLLDAAPDDPVAAGDASVSGRVRMTVPVQTDVRRILEEVGLEARIPRIGPSTLDAMLAAMDPHGADPAIAAQRRMVAMGGPRNLVITVRNGRLSLEGEVEAFGVRLKLPPVRRVSLADLPVRDMMEPFAEALGSVGRMARLWRAAAIILEDDGIRFSKRHADSPAR